MIDLASQQADVAILGRGTDFSLGSSAATGDLSGDGVADLAVGAAGGSGPDGTRTEAGEVQVFLGQSAFESVLDMAKQPSEFVVYGQNPGDRLGDIASLAIGDINSDGVGDLIMGVPASNGPDNKRMRAGAVYVVFGRQALGGALDLAKQPADLTIYGADQLDWFGQRVAVGDLNDDGIDDLVIAAPLGDDPGNTRINCGEVMVFYGGRQRRGVVDLAVQMPDLIVYGTDAGDLLGSSLAIGDLNGDRVADLIMGSIGGDGPGNSRGELTGEVNVVFSKPTLSGTLDLSVRRADQIIFGGDKEDIFGFACIVADVKGDGIGDLIVSSPRSDGPGNRRPNAGEVYVFSGSTSPRGSFDLRKRSPDLTVYGVDKGDGLGFRVAAVDMSGDRINDLVMTANGGDGPKNKRGEGTGEVYVLFTMTVSGGKRTPLTGTVDLYIRSADITVYGGEAGGELGYSIAVADLNDDGPVDLAASAVYSSGPNNMRPGAGEVYVLFGNQ